MRRLVSVRIPGGASAHQEQARLPRGAGEPPDWRITCFFVDKAHRRQGVAPRALEGALRADRRPRRRNGGELPRVRRGPGRRRGIPAHRDRCDVRATRVRANPADREEPLGGDEGRARSTPPARLTRRRSPRASCMIACRMTDRHVSITWLGCASVEIRSANRRIAIDPYLHPDDRPASVICITHADYDHCHEPTLRRLVAGPAFELMLAAPACTAMTRLDVPCNPDPSDLSFVPAGQARRRSTPGSPGSRSLGIAARPRSTSTAGASR